MIVNGSRHVGDFEVVDAEALARLRELDDGGDAFLLEVIELYLDAAPDHLEAIAEALENDDRDAMIRHAHSLKGSASELGARRVEKLAELLEHTPAGGPVAELVARLRDAHGATARALDAIVARGAEPGAL